MIFNKLLIFLLFFFAIHYHLAANALEKNILIEFIAFKNAQLKKGHEAISKDDLIIKNISISEQSGQKEGGQNKGIYLIMTKAKERVVAKVLIDPDEAKKFQDLIPLVRELNADENLPKAVKYLGKLSVPHNDTYESVILLEFAPGKQLDNFLKEDLKKYDRKETIEHLSHIAQLMGRFHNLRARAVINRFGQQEISGMTHGDISVHLGNLFYEPSQKRLTFIDYSDMKVKDESDREIDSFFSVLGRSLKDSDLKIFMDAYLSTFAPGPIQIVAKKSVLNGINVFASNSEFLKLRKEAVKEWHKLSSKDPRRKTIMPLFRYSKLKEILQELFPEEDLSSSIWNEIIDGLLFKIYEIITQDKVFWVRKALDKNDYYRHESLQKRIDEINSNKAIPHLLPLKASFSMQARLIDDGSSEEFLLFEGAHGDTLPELIKTSLKTGTAETIRADFEAIGKSIGSFNAINSDITAKNGDLKISGNTHGLLWYSDYIIFHPEDRSLSFLEYGELNFTGDVARDAYRFFFNVANMLYTDFENNWENAERIEYIIRALVNGYLNAFSSEEHRIILRPEIYEALSVYLYNFYKQTLRIDDLVSLKAREEAKKAQKDLAKKYGLSEK